MATFVVSLFLPYTVQFEETEAQAARLQPDEAKSALVFDPALKKTSLLSETPPQSPDLDPFQFAPRVDSASPSVHFARPQDPRTFANSDAFAPEWGLGSAFGQPLSQAAPIPPATILQYTKTDLPSTQRHNVGSNGNRKILTEEKWVVKPSIQGNAGLRNAINAAAAQGHLEQKTWIGTLGFPTNALNERQKGEIGDVLENEHETLAVFIDDSDFDGHYRHFCKTILWPVFHYQIPDHPKSKAYEDHSWIHYVRVNEAFAAKIVQSYKHGDIVWLHDYHLLLVPALVRKKLPDARIGFFLHIAFPSSEVFRCLAARKHLLEGMLGANLLMFQTQEYVHHFLQACSRLLVVETTEHGVQLDDHFVDVKCMSIGIVPDQIETFRTDSAVVGWIQTLEDKYRNKKLIVSRDKFDNIKGIRQKLLAYEKFLKDNINLRHNVVLFQVAATTTSGDSNKDTAVSDIVTRINSQYSSLDHQPIVFLKQDIAFSQYLALLSVADCLIITSLREGMNLTSHEYVICQQGNAGGSKRCGPLILSEFTGSAALFKGMEIAINPWDYNQIARGIRHALLMSNNEKAYRHMELLKRVHECDGASWVRELGASLERAYDDHQIRDTMSIPRLSIPTLCEQYKASTNRCFILDYEGTLAFWGSPGKAVMTSPEKVINVLIDLIAASENNIIYVASARTPAELEHVFRQLPNLGLIAENGCFVRPFGGDDWIDIGDMTTQSTALWKEGVMGMLIYYRERIEGSWIEERNRSIVFHYEDVPEADREAAERQAGDAADHISENCLTQRMRAVPAEKYFVVEPCDINKETAARWVLQNLTQRLDMSAISSEGTRAPSELDIRESDQLSQPRSSSEINAASQTLVSPKSVSSNAETPRDYSSISLSPRINDSHGARTHRRSTCSSCRSGTPARRSSSTRNLSRTERVRSVSLRRRLLADFDGEPPVDFLMVAGDDRDDEPVFRWANSLSQACSELEDCGIKNVVTVCVGRRNTDASCTLTQGIAGLLNALHKLASC